jgi:hypothetical protein
VEDKKQISETEKGAKKDIAPNNIPQVTYFLQLSPTSYFLPPSDSTIILWLHRAINLLIISVSLVSNHFLKAHCVATQHMEVISYSNIIICPWPQRSTFIKAKCIQSLSKSLHSLNSFNIVQKSKSLLRLKANSSQWVLTKSKRKLHTFKMECSQNEHPDSKREE